MRQLVTESALMSAAGCVLGMALVVGGLRGFVHFAAGSLPRLSEVTADKRVLAIALAVSAATTLLFGVLPALRAGSIDIRTVLQRAGRGVAGGQTILRRALVGGEVALSLMLLTGAALMFQTLWHMEHDHLGFPPEHVVSVSIPLRGPQREMVRRTALTAETLAFVRTLPGVEAAGSSECTPLSGGAARLVFTRADRPLPEAFHRGDGISVCGVGAGYFEAAGVRVVRGRVMKDADYDHPDTVAVINEAAARTYFPGEDPMIALREE